MRDFFFFTFLAFIAWGGGILVGANLATDSDTYQVGKHAQELIVECESALPRDESCKLEAVK